MTPRNQFSETGVKGKILKAAGDECEVQRSSSVTAVFSSEATAASRQRGTRSNSDRKTMLMQESVAYTKASPNEEFRTLAGWRSDKWQRKFFRKENGIRGKVGFTKRSEEYWE